MKITVFWDVAPCSLIEVDQYFIGAHCLHHRGDELATPIYCTHSGREAMGGYSISLGHRIQLRDKHPLLQIQIHGLDKQGGH
jgi:hypothetical protein